MSDDDVPVGALLGAAYEAVVHGQGLAAREAIALVKELGFEKDGSAKPFRFAYQRTESTDTGPQVRTVHATVPLLSLVNPPVISIDSAAISMSLHLVSQDIEPTRADALTVSGGAPAGEEATPRLRGRIVHQSDKNAVMTIQSTLKQRDLLASSRLSQLLDAAVSDRDGSWYRVLDLAEAFRAAATALIDAVAQDGSDGKAVGVREWLQQLWELKEAVTDAVSAFRDGLPEKVPSLHQRWNTLCGDLRWIDRRTELETMAQLRRTFLATARAVWHAFLPGTPVAEFGPPTAEQMRIRFESAVAALTESVAARPGLAALPSRLHQLEGAVAQGCTAHKYGGPEAVITQSLDRYNATATQIRKEWGPYPQWALFSPALAALAAVGEAVWDALAPDAKPVDFRPRSIEAMDAECTLLRSELAARCDEFPSYAQKRVAAFALAQTLFAQTECKRHPEEVDVHKVEGFFTEFNERVSELSKKWPEPHQDEWRSLAGSWNDTARQFWGRLLDADTHPVTDVTYPEIP